MTTQYKMSLITPLREGNLEYQEVTMLCAYSVRLHDASNVRRPQKVLQVDEELDAR